MTGEAALRSATAADAAALAALARDSFTETFGHLYSAENLAAFLAGHTTEGWAAILASPADVVRVIEAGGTLAGYARLGTPKLPFEPEAGAIELRQFYLLKPWHGRGLADELMAWALDEAARRGAPALYLSVFEDNERAKRFYARHGFAFVTEHAFMVGDHRDTDHILRRIVSPPHTRSRLLTAPHGFFGREGGVSIGEMASLNCGLGSGDEPALVAENRARVRDAVCAGGRLVGVWQVHGREVAAVSEPWSDETRPHADALVTDRPGVALSILTADCAPVLFEDRTAGVVGAAHAGWKGALAGVTDATLDAMEALGARRDRIAAAVGPCIAQASYEVDDAFCARFAAADPANERFFKDGGAGHARFDLEGYVVARLAAAGVRAVDALGLDTLALEDRYYSYRRATLAGEPDYGRQMSAIALAG